MFRLDRFTAALRSIQILMSSLTCMVIVRNIRQSLYCKIVSMIVKQAELNVELETIVYK